MIEKESVDIFSTEKMPFLQIPSEFRQKQQRITKKHYRENPHPIFSPEDIVIELNSDGYRCPEFNLRHQLSKETFQIVSVGCSGTFGAGLPESKTYPAIFKELIQTYLNRPAINWNLGFNGGSSDYMLRILASALPILQPDIVLLTFPPIISRREHIGENGRVFQLTPHRMINLEKIIDPESAEIVKSYKRLRSSYNDSLNLFKNYKACEALCNQFEVMWLFSSFNISIFEEMSHLIDREKLVSPGLATLKDKYLEEDPAVALAFDMMHPGIKPNEDFAKNYFDKLQKVYANSLEKLKYAEAS